ncbi:MAG: ComF family protein [Rickettsiales bacterium]|jgi:ComF family protein
MIKKLVKKLIKLIFPKNCLICNQIISGGDFCAADWNNIRFLHNPACSICFEPFEFKIDDEMLCGACLQRRPEYFKLVAALGYNEESKSLITQFKYFDQTHLAKYFSKLMYGAAQEIMGDIDFIAPVPLHKIRIIKRKYNQSAMLAKNIGSLGNKKTILDLLNRTKNNKPQASLNQKDRRKNVAGIFEVKGKYFPQIKGKNILLIDDVITTGSTVESCANILKKAGAERIYILVIAKTLRD